MDRILSGAENATRGSGRRVGDVPRSGSSRGTGSDDGTVRAPCAVGRRTGDPRDIRVGRRGSGGAAAGEAGRADHRQQRLPELPAADEPGQRRGKPEERARIRSVSTSSSTRTRTCADFYQALKEFNKRARDADVALVYYAGHAVQFRGRNYLIQVDDEAETLDDINIGSIPVEKILDILATVKGVKVLVLDACRDNPAKGKQAQGRSIGVELTRDIGLARLDDYDTSYGAGMVIAYATSASHVAEDGEGKNSPYNIALTKWITAPDLTIPDIFTNVTGTVVASTNQRQHPIFDSSLTGKYILNPTGSEWVDWANVQNSTDLDKLQRFLDAHPDSAHAPFVRHQVDVLQQSLAESSWDRIRDGTDPAALQAFREKFPASPHAAEADRKIAALRQKAEDAAREAQAWERAKAASDLDAVAGVQDRLPQLASRRGGGSQDRVAEAGDRGPEARRRRVGAGEGLDGPRRGPGVQIGVSQFAPCGRGGRPDRRPSTQGRGRAEGSDGVGAGQGLARSGGSAELPRPLSELPVRRRGRAQAGRSAAEGRRRGAARRRGTWSRTEPTSRRWRCSATPIPIRPTRPRWIRKSPRRRPGPKRSGARRRGPT